LDKWPGVGSEPPTLAIAHRVLPGRSDFKQ
jgi:hypothetical protein